MIYRLSQKMSNRIACSIEPKNFVMITKALIWLTSSQIGKLQEKSPAPAEQLAAADQRWSTLNGREHPFEAIWIRLTRCRITWPRIKRSCTTIIVHPNHLHPDSSKIHVDSKRRTRVSGWIPRCWWWSFLPRKFRILLQRYPLHTGWSNYPGDPRTVSSLHSARYVVTNSFLGRWFGDYGGLEYKHGYIQWL